MVPKANPSPHSYSFTSLLVQQIRVAAKKEGTNELYQLAQTAKGRDKAG